MRIFSLHTHHGNLMKCHLCDSEGTVFFTKIIDNKLQQLCYCHGCALSQGLLNTEPHSSELAALVLNSEAEEDLPLSAHALLECPKCGFSLHDWRRTRRLGCSHCYDTFAQDISPYINTIQESRTHFGKHLSSLEKREEKWQKQQSLQEELDAAIEREDYEMAAKIRDQIADLH